MGLVAPVAPGKAINRRSIHSDYFSTQNMTMLMCQVCQDSRQSSSSSVEEDFPADIYVPLPNEDSAVVEYDECYCLPTYDCPARPLVDEGEGREVTHQDLEALRRMAGDVMLAVLAFQDRSPGQRHAETQPTAFGPGSLASSAAHTIANSLSSRPDTPRPDYRGDGHMRRQDRMPPPPPPAAARPAEPPRRATDSPNHPSCFPGVPEPGRVEVPIARSFSMPSLPFVVRRNPDGSIMME